jgi:SAM-dependent methyltransferase
MADDSDPRAVARQGKDYWNDRARRSGGDAIRAACLDEPIANACIEAVQRKILEEALSRLARRRSLRGATVLDFGCGSGRWIETLRREGCRHVGIDVARGMLALARGGHRDGCLVAIDGERLPFADRTFDLIWSVAAVHHNPHDAQERIVAELSRVLKGDGAIVLFEGVGPRRAAGEVYWPRPLGEWMDIGARHGLRCVWRRGARYMVLASAVERIFARSQEAGVRRREGSGGGRGNFWWRAAGRIDVWLDPFLLRVLPARFQSRAAMVFVRTGGR